MIVTYLFIYDSRASDFGLMKIDNTGRVLSFSEKPRGNELKAMVIAGHSSICNLKSMTNVISSVYISGSRHNCFGTIARRGREEALHCFDGSLRLQEGNTSESSKAILLYSHIVNSTVQKQITCL